jgi:hypothetical protein
MWNLWASALFYWLLQSAARTIFVVFIGLSAVTAYVGHSYYKALTRPTANAVISSIETKCVYAKRRIIRVMASKYKRKYVDCNAEEVKDLIADGYRKDGTSSDVWVIYEPEPGRKTRAMVDTWSIDSSFVWRVGRSVPVRYNPRRPDKVDYASEVGHKGTVLSVIIIGLLGFGCALFVHLPDFEHR